MNYRRSKGFWGLVLIVSALFFVFLIFIIILMGMSKSISRYTSSGGVDFNENSGPVAVVDIKGVILESRKTIKKLIIAEKDKQTKAIIVRISSPGGAVAPTQEIYEEIRRIDKKIPVYASMGSVAASGGYYIAAATRKIFANAGTLTGSIGVIMHFMNLEKLYKFIKVSPQIVKGGKYKDIGSQSRPMTKRERELLQNMIASVHNQFRSAILATRKDRLKKPILEITQGQIFSGEMAKKIGLVDEIAGLWAAGRIIHKELKLSSKFNLHFIKLKKDFSISKVFSEINETASEFKDGLLLNRVPLLMFR